MTAAVLDQLPNARRRQRQIARLDAQRTQRIGNRVRHQAADRDDAAFAGALGAERIDRGGMRFHDEAANFRKITRGRHEIVGKRAGEKLAIVVVSQMLQKCAAEALHHSANELTLER